MKSLVLFVTASTASRRTIVPLILGLAITAPSAAAQGRSPAPGDRVRVNVCERNATDACRRIVGSFVSWTPDRLVLRDSAGLELHVSAGSQSVLEMSRGRRSRFGRGILYGLLGGVGLGAALTLSCADGAGEDAALCAGLLPIGVGAGTVVGGLIGAMATSERWVAADRPEGLTIEPSRGGVRIGFTQPF